MCSMCNFVVFLLLINKNAILLYIINKKQNLNPLFYEKMSIQIKSYVFLMVKLKTIKK